MQAPRQPNVRFDVVIGQIRPEKSDYAANLKRIGMVFGQIATENLPCDVLALPETVTTGYFLEGGVRELAVTREQLLSDLAREYADSPCDGPLDIALGFYELGDGKYYNSGMYASLDPVASRSRIIHVHRKFFLPTYGVFDEKRFVSRGRTIETFDTRFGRCALLICEDVWHSVTGVIAALKGAKTIYVITASPGRGFSGDMISNAEKYRRLLVSLAEEHSVFVVNASLVGFEGGKGFVGHSVMVDPFGRVQAEGPLGEEALVCAQLCLDDIGVARANSPLLADLEANAADIALEMSRLILR